MSPQALQEMTERHAGVIAELTGILMNAARHSEAEIVEAASPEAAKQAHDRLPGLARAVRLCLAMEGRVMREGLKDQVEAERREREAADQGLAAQRRKAEAAELARRAERHARKALVQDRVEHIIEKVIDYRDEDELEPYYEDLRTRLLDETFEAEFAHLPYEEVVRTLHRDLKLPEPVFTGQDQVRALIWAAQWGHPAEHPSPEAQAPEPNPPPESDFRYSSA